jgi:predicted ester cyclase
MPETSVEENVASVRRWFDQVWNKKNSVAIHEMLAPDCVTHGTHDAGGDVRGPQGFSEFQARILDAFPDMHIEVQDAFGFGDKVAVRWVATMHHLGAGLGIEPTGAAIAIGGMGIARFANGKLAEAWDNWDKHSMFDRINAAAAAAQSKSASA